MPRAGHVVHMPAHVYLRVGRYADAARANIEAVAADRRYVPAHAVPGDFYPTFYPAHNEHFLWMVYVLSGQRSRALASAQELTRTVSVADARANASLEAFLSGEVLTHEIGRASCRERVEDWACEVRRGTKVESG